jgi:hypothetical protein
MRTIGTTKLMKGKKAQILVKAIEQVGWQEEELLVEFVNDAKDAVILMRARDVLDEEKIREKRGEIKND